MSIKNEISRIIGLPCDEAFANLYLVLGDESVYISGVKKIISLESGGLKVQLKSGYLDVSGDGLTVKEVSVGTVVVVGKVNNISLSGV